MEKEALERGKAILKKAVRILRKAAAAKFFVPIITGISAILLFAGTVRRYGIRAAVRGAAKAEKQLHPRELHKWKQRCRKRRSRRRIALVRILTSKKTKKRPGYKKLIKLLKLYR